MLRSYFHKTLIEAGLDEAGRGCLAGPVYAAAVILPKKFRHPLLNDSKQLTEQERNRLRPIIEKKAICWAVASVQPEEIDQINILRAAFKAMHLAVEQLAVAPELLLVDGNRFTPYPFIPHQCIIQGDGLYASIAAASVLAKTYRDEHMKRLHEEFPLYGWASNKGYATKDHQEALNQHGPCQQHRRSFRLDYSLEPVSLSDEEPGAQELSIS
ncbi:MAG: ribonuclease HII [Chitinophagaceae bacterium]|nr:MAG: ribonuclease HII [Chitinophagaceae bacterium]